MMAITDGAKGFWRDTPPELADIILIAVSCWQAAGALLKVFHSYLPTNWVPVLLADDPLDAVAQEQACY